MGLQCCGSRAVLCASRIRHSNFALARQSMVPLVDGYRKRIDEEETKTTEELAVSGVGKVRPESTQGLLFVSVFACDGVAVAIFCICIAALCV